MEAPGIEPGSRNRAKIASTGLFRHLYSALAPDGQGSQRETTGVFSLGAPGDAEHFSQPSLAALLGTALG